MWVYVCFFDCLFFLQYMFFTYHITRIYQYHLYIVYIHTCIVFKKVCFLGLCWKHLVGLVLGWLCNILQWFFHAFNLQHTHGRDMHHRHYAHISRENPHIYPVNATRFDLCLVVPTFIDYICICFVWPLWRSISNNEKQSSIIEETTD